MNRICKASILAVLLAAVLLGSPVITLGAVIEVSQPVQVTDSGYYERGQSIVYDGTDYWLFYGRSASFTGWYQSGNPDIHDYQIYYKKASTVAGLASATATAVPGAANCYNGEIGAAVHGGNVWTFAAVLSTNFTGRRSLYGWYWNGSSWTQVADMADNLPPGAAHHDETSFGGNLFIMANYPDGNSGWYTKYTADPTAATIAWSSYVPLNSTLNLINGTGHFYVEGTELYIAMLSTYPSPENKILQWVASPEGWSQIATALTTAYDPTLVKVGSTYLFAQAPWISAETKQYIVGWSSTSLSTVLSGTDVSITTGKYGTNTWVDMWPIGFTDAGGTSYLFYTSERDVPAQEQTGNIWFLELNWDVSREHYTWVQEGIDAAVASDEVHIVAGTYEENVTVDKTLTLAGEQFGVDARGRAGDETVLTCAAGHLVTVAAIDVVLDGLTLTGTSATNRLGNCESHGSGFEMRNCAAGGVVVQGFWFNVTSPDIVFEYNAIDASLWTASYATMHFDTDVFDNLYIGNNEFTGGSIFAGGEVYNSTGFQLVDNLFDGCSLNLSSQFENAAITGNIFRNNGYTNMQVGLKNSTIAYNQFEATGPSPHVGYPSCSMMLYGTVYGLTPAENVVIEGNTFDFNGFAIPADPANGLRILADIDATTITIRDNSFNDGAAQATAVAVLNQGTGDADASGNWWGSNVPATVNALANGGTLVDYTPWLDTGTDNRPGIGFEGDFSALHVSAASPQTGTVGRAQEGIDLVDGSTVYLHDGTYEEQLEIDADIVLQGDGSGTIVLCPDALSLFFTTSADNYPIVYIHDTGDAEIHDLTIDGAGKGNANTRFNGVAFSNAGGGIYDCDILDVRDTPFSGAQHGVGVNVWNDDLTARSIDVHDCVITGFQKNAMALNSDATTDLAVDVRGNTITGAGATDITAQNGVQVWCSTATGTVADNVISGIAYDNTANPIKYVATSILNIYADLDITGNTITGSHTAIYNIDGSGTIEGNDLTIEKVGVAAWGIIGSDPPRAVPSPFADETEPLGSSRPILGAPLALLDVDIIGNTVTFSGSDNSSTYGIEADAGYGPDDLDVTISYNTVCGFEAGIDIWHGGSDTGLFTSIVCNYNYLGCGNDYGIRSNAAYIVTDGTNNWWGDATGPYHSTNTGGLGVEVSDYIDFDPWMGAENVVSVLPDYGTTNCTDPITFTFWFDHAGTTDEVRGVDVTFDVDGAVVIVGDELTDIDEGTYLPGFGGTIFFALDKGSEEYTVSTSILGGTTGATGSGDLFTVEFTPVDEGLSAITITDVKVRDVDNASLGSAMVGGEVRIDCTEPTMEAIVEAEGECYNIAPTFANFGFDDDQALDLAEYQIDADVEVTIFTGINLPEWNGDGWALPGFAGLSEGSHTVYFYVADMAGNENGEGTPDTYSWSFIKDTLAPDPPTGFTAMPGHNKVHLAWTNPTGDGSFTGVEIRRVAWGDYPEYLTAPSYPADQNGGALVTQETGESFDDDPRSLRDIYYYAAFSYDCAGNYSTYDAGAADRSTSYWLGDIRAGYDGFIDGSDLLDFSNAFGLGDLDFGWNNEADFGPTDDWSRLGIPEPDDVIDFEDLMIFSMNFGNVDPLSSKALPVEKSPENLENMIAFELIPSVTDEGTIVSIVLSNHASTLKGARLLVETADGCEIVRVTKGDALVKRADVFFGKIPAFNGTEICIAALGIDRPLAGSGEIAKILVKSKGTVSVSLAEVEVRDIGNRQFVLEGTGGYEGPEIPVADNLSQNFPNPFNPATTVAFDLARSATVRIGIYDVSGRLVRTLVDRSMEAGSHEVGWNGSNNAGIGVPSGLYFYRMTTSEGFTATRKMILLR